MKNETTRRVVEIDANSGFCFGVVTAIEKAEAELSAGKGLHCLGDIVHNASEVERLRLRGLITITHDDLDSLRDSIVLLRAHGEPPTTYARLKANNNRVIDATCPVVLRLQRRIKQAYDKARDDLAAGVIDRMPLILIYGKEGHAEVNGLVGQTDGTAIVIQNVEALDRIDLGRDILLYSQTTKSLEGYSRIIAEIERRKSPDTVFEHYDTICRSVSGRVDRLRSFAAAHEVVLFVAGTKSSNGRILYDQCRAVNPRTHLIANASHLEPQWLDGAASVGICGATSTPLWLMEQVRDAAAKFVGTDD